MTLPRQHLDPDDSADGDDAGDGLAANTGVEGWIWQLLLVINPGDEDAALQQFGAFQDALDGADADDIDAVQVLKDVIDWKSGFHIGETDTGALIEALNELAARYNLAIDWGVEDPTDAEFLARVTATELLNTAHDQLRLDGYTLWTWDTGTDALAGWMTLADDDEGMRVIAAALGIEVRGAGL